MAVQARFYLRGTRDNNELCLVSSSKGLGSQTDRDTGRPGRGEGVNEVPGDFINMSFSMKLDLYEIVFSVLWKSR